MARERRIPGAVPKESWPAWFHAPNGDSAIFQTRSEVPDGWTRKKQSEYNAPTAVAIDKDATIARLKQLKIFVDPRWGAAKLKKVLEEND